jgi:hypothetical protein
LGGQFEGGGGALVYSTSRSLFPLFFSLAGAETRQGSAIIFKVTGVVNGVATTSLGINATQNTEKSYFKVQRKLLGLNLKPSALYFTYSAGTDPYAVYHVDKQIVGKTITGATDVVFTVTGFLEAKTKPAADDVGLGGTFMDVDDAPAAGAGAGSRK